MNELTPANYETLCQSEPVKAQIEGLDATRKAAAKKYWMFLIGGIVLTLILTVIIAGSAPGLTLFILIGGIVASWFVADGPLKKTKKALKGPVLESIADQGGMTFKEKDFIPPGYANAERVLFGGFLSGEYFSDLFQSKPGVEPGFGFYEASLTRGRGKQRQQVFTGQVYGFNRRQDEGVTAIVPDRGMFNFFKPGKGMTRVQFTDHPEFEKRFEVYSTNPAQAQALLGSQAVRDQLLAMRAKGRLYGYLAPGEALFAISGPNRFEPGGMLKSIPAETRVKTMFNDVCSSLTVLKGLKDNFS